MNNPLLVQRINQNLLCLVLITGILYFAKAFLIPLAFAIMLAMLMVPLCRTLDKRGMNRGGSVLSCVAILLLVIIVIITIVSLQILSFAEDLPQLEERLNAFLSDAHNFIRQNFDISKQKQKLFLKRHFDTSEQSIGEYVSGFLSTSASLIAGIVLTLVYTFLLLYHKEKYELFFLKIFKDEDRTKIKASIDKIADVAQCYLKGRTISILILAILYSGGLILVGIKHSILLGCIAALLTVVPYVGTLIGGFFPLMMAIITEESWEPALWVIGIITLIQTIDNYFIEPYIIGGEVNLSALATILAIIAGGILWGIAGMILFIPMLGIAKIIFDNIDKLKPLGFLISDPDKSPKIPAWFGRKSPTNTKHA